MHVQSAGLIHLHFYTIMSKLPEFSVVSATSVFFPNPLLAFNDSTWGKFNDFRSIHDLPSVCTMWKEFIMRYSVNRHLS